MKKCPICNEEYDPKETKRIYGEQVALSGVCSAGCYTKKHYTKGGSSE